jgi:peptidoglycan/xylan/chitin deacetylase (PgdA/CDA1 family)
MTAVFIVSIDCEGKWGMADRVDEARSITDDSLDAVYAMLFSTLDRYQIAATFAVVGLFAAGPEAVDRFARATADSPAHRRWLAAPIAAVRSGVTSGWFRQSLFDEIRSVGAHELATHGASHLPFDAVDVGEAERRLELDWSRRLGAERGARFSTLVYPRNAVVQSDILGDYHITGYRGARKPTAMGRLGHLLSEFNLLARAQSHSRPPWSGEIPCGIFLNWRHGLRATVPLSVSIRRWRHILDDAERTDGVAHLWFHPHNLITAPTTALLLDAVLAMVHEREVSGSVVVSTQADYCAAHRLPSPNQFGG